MKNTLEKSEVIKNIKNLAAYLELCEGTEFTAQEPIPFKRVEYTRDGKELEYVEYKHLTRTIVLDKQHARLLSKLLKLGLANLKKEKSSENII